MDRIGSDSIRLGLYMGAFVRLVFVPAVGIGGGGLSSPVPVAGLGERWSFNNLTYCESGYLTHLLEDS